MSTFFVPRFLDIKTIASPVPNSWARFYKAGNLKSSQKTAVTPTEDTFLACFGRPSGSVVGPRDPIKFLRN